MNKFFLINHNIIVRNMKHDYEYAEIIDNSDTDEEKINITTDIKPKKKE